MRNEVKLLLASGIILALFFTSIGCIGTNDHDKDDDDKIDPTDLPNNGPQQQEGTLKDIDFHIEIEDNTLVDGKFNVACSLKNTDMESHIISGPGLGFPTLDFIIYTPEDTIIHFLGPWVRCRCLPDNIELPSGIHYHWTSTIGGNHQVWGEDSQDPYVESYAFEPGNYIMYGNYTSDPKSSENNTDFSGWTQSNILNFTLEDPQTTSNDQLKCEPEVKVTGYNYTSDPESVPFQEVQSLQIITQA